MDGGVYSGFRDVAGQDGGLKGVYGGAEVFDAEEDIGTGLYGKDTGFGGGVLAGDGPHFHGVGNNDAVKAHFFTKNAC